MIPYAPVRNMPTATATTNVLASVVEADPRWTKSARPGTPTRSPRPRPMTETTVQRTVKARRGPTRIWELDGAGMLSLEDEPWPR